MAKVTIKASIPRGSIEKMLDLSETIIEKHEELGADSPFSNARMQKFKQRTIKAREAHDNAKKFHAEAEVEMMRAYTSVGIAKGQTSRTDDTNYFDIDVFRSLLLGKYKGEEEALEQFGFTVVLKKVMTGRKGKKK